MLNFAQFITEAASDNLQGNIRNIKTRGHVKRYIFPMLSSKQKKQAVKSLGSFFNAKDIKDVNVDEDGEKHDPEGVSHTLASPANGHERGTPVRVTGVYIDGDSVMARTHEHGDMPLTKLTKGSLAAKNKTEAGFELEHTLQRNIDPRFKPAGSTGDSWDFVAGNPDEENSIKGKAVKKDESKPIFRGESKASKKGTVSMGTISASFNEDTKKWEYAKGKSKMADKFSEAVHPQSGLPLLDHLNKYHSNGKLDKGFTVSAPNGTTRHYLNGLNANSLHLHRYAKDAQGNYTMNHGTTYTVGDDNQFQGHLGMGHLSDDDLDKLDGSITVEQSGVGKVQIKHKPKPGVFNEYANRSKNDPDNHLDLSREDHGSIFRDRFTQHVAKLSGAAAPTSAPTSTPVPTPQPQSSYPAGTRVRQAAARNPSNWTQNQPQRPVRETSPLEQHATASHGGMSMYSDDEQKHIKGEV